MEKKKKIILISVILIIVLIIAGVVGYLICRKSNKEESSKIARLYDTLNSKTSYSFETILNDNNKVYYAKQEDKAHIDTIYKGNESKFIIKDGNAYLIIDENEAYYTYTNNQMDLNKIEDQMTILKELEYERGKEKIDNKTYDYEEYKVPTSFTMMDTSEVNDEEIKTRFYFKSDKLEYIKTILGDKQELLKVDISYKVDNELFEIPSNYKEG